jgi:hypothetical protein
MVPSQQQVSYIVSMGAHQSQQIDYLAVERCQMCDYQCPELATE